jgi:hypothetical protein
MAAISPHALVTPRRLFFTGLALLVIALLIQLWILHDLRLTFEALKGRQRPGQIPNEKAVLTWISLLAIPGPAIALTGFFLGLLRTRQAAEWAGITGYAWSYGWTAGSFFIPILNFYRPWVGLGEIRRSVFVSLASRQTGKKWNRFGDLSAATIALAAAVFVIAGGQIVYNLTASSIWVVPHGPTEFFALLRTVRSHVVVNMAFIAGQIGVLFVYYETLQGPSAHLVLLAADGELSQ